MCRAQSGDPPESTQSGVYHGLDMAWLILLQYDQIASDSTVA
jgi:hypothetical protein